MLGGRDGRRLAKRTVTYAEFKSKAIRRDIFLRDCVRSMAWKPFVHNAASARGGSTTRWVDDAVDWRFR